MQKSLCNGRVNVVKKTERFHIELFRKLNLQHIQNNTKKKKALIVLKKTLTMFA